MYNNQFEIVKHVVNLYHDLYNFYTKDRLRVFSRRKENFP